MLLLRANGFENELEFESSERRAAQEWIFFCGRDPFQAYNSVYRMVDAMVLSGCRICGNLTYDILHIEGGTRRQCKPSNEQQPIG
jgi:hypothetical protein